MFKQALYTYWTSLHPRNLKYIVDKRWHTFIFVFVLLPDLAEIEEYGAGAFYAFTVFLPIALMKMSNLARKINIPKALFLAPMQQKERENYIKCLIGIKIGASVLLGLIIELVWYVTYQISVVDILVCLFAYVSFGIAEYFCVEGTFDNGSKVEHGIRVKEGYVTYATSNLLTIAGAWLVFMGMASLPGEEETVQLWTPTVDPILAGILLIMLVLDVFIVIRQYRDMLNSVCNYEPSIQLEKEEK